MNSAVLNQPAHAAQTTSLRLLAAIIFCFVLFSLGCRSDPGCRRETALLRAEILDMEDKYAFLQARYQSTASELHQFTGAPVDQTMYGTPSHYQDVILNQQIISNGEIISDNGAYPGYVESYPSQEVIYGSPLQSYPQGSGIIIDDPTVQLGTPYSQGQIVEPSQNFGQPFNGTINESIGNGIFDPNESPIPASPQNENSLPLPNDTRNQRGIPPEDFELEMPGLKTRRSIPATQASARLGGSRSYGVAKSGGAATEIMINQSETSGKDVDGIPGDEGLNLLLQTKDSRGEIVLQGGELTVSLIDPKQRQRIGFWRFLAGETELFFVDRGQDTDGILLHLPWDESTPRRSRLLVHVQFVTQDGRTLTTSSDVRIKTPTGDYSPDDPQVINWTQSDALWGDNLTEVEPLTDSFQVGIEDRRRAEEAWQQNGTYQRGAKFSPLHDHDSKSRGSSSRNASRLNKAADNLDQPKWRPVR